MTIPLSFSAAIFPLSSLELPLEDGGGTGGDGAPGLVGRLSMWLSTGGDRLGGVISSLFCSFAAREVGDFDTLLLALRDVFLCFFALGFLSRLLDRDGDRDRLLLVELFVSISRGGDEFLFLSLPLFALGFLSRLSDRERDE